MNNICVIGTGYAGLVTGACLADFGNRVTCVDIDEDKINLLNNGKLPIYEPGLQEIVDKNVQGGHLYFSTDVSGTIQDSKILFIAVETPSGTDGDVDLQYVMNVAKLIGENLNSYKVVVNKSTVSLGTGKKVLKMIRETNITNEEFDVVSNPEFLREGSAIIDFLRPDRIVIGTESEKARKIMKGVYKSLYINEVPIIETDVETAEMIKYASNAFLSVKISFMNEIANLCDKTGANIHTIAKAMGLDGRISPKFLHPGPGYGGSCFPKDTIALTRLAEEHDVSSDIVSAAINVNSKQRQIVVNKLKEFIPELKDKTIAVLGLSFKPNTDDVRESPAIDIINLLLKEGAKIQAYDPIAMDNARLTLPEIKYYSNSLLACENADALLLMTEWNEFRQLDFQTIKNVLSTPNVIDCRNMYDPIKMKELGFNYLSIGRPLRK